MTVGVLQIEMIAPRTEYVVRPQLLGRPWGGTPLAIDLAELCDLFGATFRHGRVRGVVPGEHAVDLVGGDRAAYDHLLLAVGAEPMLSFFGVHTLSFGPLPTALAGSPGHVAILVPPGVAWTLPAYELALLMAAEHHSRVDVVTWEREPLDLFGPGAAEAVAGLLAEHDVNVETSFTVRPGQNPADLADHVVALPLLRGPDLAGLPTDPHGYVDVDAHMRVPGTDAVHAAGDATTGAVKQGGLGAQQAEVACTDIAHRCGSPWPSTPYSPVLRGKLTAPGGQELYLRRDLFGEDRGTASSEPLWQPAGVICAWRTMRWLVPHLSDGDADPLEYLAHPSAVLHPVTHA